MGTVVVLTAERVTELINAGIVNAVINGSGNLIFTKADASIIDVGDIKEHGTMTGLLDDDHTQYALADGTRGEFATTAQGDKADAARPNLQAETDFDGGDAGSWIEEFTVTDDDTATSGWVNRFVGWFRHRVAGAPVADNLRRMVIWFNEYMELRLAPAKHNTVALRLFVRDTGTTQTNARDQDVPIFELMDDRGIRTPILGLYPNGHFRIAEDMIETAHVLLLGPADPVPTGTPAGTIIVRTE